jgi:hypothetical protein
MSVENVGRGNGAKDTVVVDDASKELVEGNSPAELEEKKEVGSEVGPGVAIDWVGPTSPPASGKNSPVPDSATVVVITGGPTWDTQSTWF